MPDIFLRAGEANPSDVRLRDPTAADAGGAATITCVGIESAEAFGTPSIEAVEDLAGVASAEAFGAASIAATVAPAGIASAETIGSPEVTATVSPGGIASVEAFGLPDAVATVSPAGIATAEAFGSPVIDTPIAATGIASGEAFGVPSAEAAVSLAGIASDEAFGSPTVGGDVALIECSGIGSAATVGLPIVSGIAPAPLPVPSGGGGSYWSGAVWPRPVVDEPSVAAHEAQLAGIASGEAFGQPVVSVGLAGVGIAGPSGKVGKPTLGSTIAPASFVDQELADRRLCHNLSVALAMDSDGVSASCLIAGVF